MNPPPLISRVLHGNCIDVMQTLPSDSVDMVLTDPPYLVNYRSRDGRSVANDVTGDWLKPAFCEIARLMKPDTFCVSFYGWQAIDQFFDAWTEAGLRPVGHLVFTKPYPSSTRYLGHHHEQAYLLAKGRPAPLPCPPADVMDWSYTGNRLHPTQKPINILQPLVEKLCPIGGLVLDPFCGSGSSLVAARLAGAAALGIELDANHCETSTRRLLQQDAGIIAYQHRRAR